jgi:hypothetical protein
MLLHMILYHICQWSGTMDHYKCIGYLFAYFMPWFFFKAGMFYKRRPIRNELTKSFGRLIRPFVIFSIAGTCVLWIKQLVLSTFTIKTFLEPLHSLLLEGSVSGNLPLWFLLSLFAVKNIFNYVYRLNKSLNFRRGLMLCLSMIWLFILLIPIDGEVFHPIFLSNISSGLLFFSLGYLLRNYILSGKMLMVRVSRIAFQI